MVLISEKKVKLNFLILVTTLLFNVVSDLVVATYILPVSVYFVISVSVKFFQVT